MKVYIEETGEQKEFILLDDEGNNDVEEFIESYDGEYGVFTYNQAKDLYFCNQEVFNFWNLHLIKLQGLRDRVKSLRELHGSEAVDDVFTGAAISFEEFVSYQHEMLDEAFGKQ